MSLLDNKKIGERLKKFREGLQLPDEDGTAPSVRQFAISVGIDTSQYSKIEKGDLPITDNTLTKILEKYPELPKEYLLHGLGTYVPRGEGNNGTSFIEKRNQLKNNNVKKNTVPFYDAKVTAGITETEMSPIHAPAGTIDIGDLLHDSQAALRIYGNSMIPNYPPGCVVGLARCQSKFIEPGEVYVIETRDRRMLKRLFYKDDNSDGELLTCYSDNIMLFEGGARNGKLAYPPFDIPKKEIINIFTVTGVIKRNANSVIINRN
jgi:transcriptional regulator with XRE-family HTH domain